MMSVLANTENALMHKAGPLPVWAWAALAGGGVLIYRVIKSNGAGASSALGTAGSTLTGSGTTSTGAGAGTTGTGTGTTGTGGSSVTSAVPGISATDLAGGSVLDFVKGLGSNYNSFSFSSGGSSVGVNNSAQNILDAANFAASLNEKAVENTNATQLAIASAQEHGVELMNEQNYMLGWDRILANAGLLHSGVGSTTNPSYQFPPSMSSPVGRSTSGSGFVGVTPIFSGSPASRV